RGPWDDWSRWICFRRINGPDRTTFKASGLKRVVLLTRPSPSEPVANLQREPPQHVSAVQHAIYVYGGQSRRSRSPYGIFVFPGGNTMPLVKRTYALPEATLGSFEKKVP